MKTKMVVKFLALLAMYLILMVQHLDVQDLKHIIRIGFCLVFHHHHETWTGKSLLEKLFSKLRCQCLKIGLVSVKQQIECMLFMPPCDALRVPPLAQRVIPRSARQPLVGYPQGLVGYAQFISGHLLENNPPKLLGYPMITHYTTRCSLTDAFCQRAETALTPKRQRLRVIIFPSPTLIAIFIQLSPLQSGGNNQINPVIGQLEINDWKDGTRHVQDVLHSFTRKPSEETLSCPFDSYSFPRLPLLASLTNGGCGPENQMVLP